MPDTTQTNNMPDKTYPGPDVKAGVCSDSLQEQPLRWPVAGASDALSFALPRQGMMKPWASAKALTQENPSNKASGKGETEQK